MKAIRNSNIELLRILGMLMVVILHFNNNGANTGIVNMPELLTTRLTWGFFVESFCIVAACMGLFTLIMLRYHCHWQIHYPFDYNNPFVVIAAVMLLLFFLSWSFQGKTINWLASSVFAAYLLQESCYWGHKWLYPQMRELFVAVPDGWRVVSLVGVSMLFLLLSIGVDKVLGLLSSGLMKVYDRLCPQK